MKIKAFVYRDKTGGYWAEVPGLPGCVTEGDTKAELKANLRDAIESWLAVAAERAKKTAGKRRSADSPLEIEV